MDKNFDDFLLSLDLPGVIKESASYAVDDAGNIPIDRLPDLSGIITVQILRQYHQWLNNQNR